MRQFRTSEGPRAMQRRVTTTSSPVSLFEPSVKEGKLCQFICPQNGDLTNVRVIINKLKGKPIPLSLVLSNGPETTKFDIVLAEKEPRCLVPKPVSVSAGDLLYVEAPGYEPGGENDIAEGLFVSFCYVLGG